MSNLIKSSLFMKSFFPIGKSLDKCFDCAYCRATDRAVCYLDTPSSISKEFINIPVAINLFYGDPLLQPNNTLNILEKLDKEGHKGPVIIITKGYISPFIEVLNINNYNLDLHIAFSTFGIDHPVDGGSYNTFKRNLLTSKFYDKFKYSIEYRPIINGINDNINEEIFKLAKDRGLAIAYSGLQGTPEMVAYWKSKGIEFTAPQNRKLGYKKYVDPKVEETILNYSKEYNVPVFRKTSCLISYVHGMDRDYNAHYYRPNEVGCPNCIMKDKCFKFYDNIKNIVNDIKLPYAFKIVYKDRHSCWLKQNGVCEFPTADCEKIKGYLIKTEEPLTTSDVRVTKWLTGLTVDTKFDKESYISKFWKDF